MRLASLILIETGYISVFKNQTFSGPWGVLSCYESIQVWSLSKFACSHGIFTAPYSNEATYQAYLKRALAVTSNQGLLQRRSDVNSSVSGFSRRPLEPMQSFNTRLSGDAAYQQYGLPEGREA